ncbi:hypothetical protein V5T82_09055 [Magnetovibrio sp. PR-2]|uniref:hypothetical protein n=1 Tax=Magnetovibrio sp. PR-2 TaxID=3120356 RepID=UPI002FCE5196
MLNSGWDGYINTDVAAEIYPEMSVYSAGVSGTNIHVMRRIAEHAVELHDVQSVIMMIDFVSMNDARPDGAGWKDERYLGGRITETPIAVYSNFLSFEMAKSSWSKLNQDEKSPVDVTRKSRTRSQRETLWQQALVEFYRYDLYGCYSLSDQTAEHLDKALAVLKQNNVDVIIMTPVIHSTLLEMVEWTNNWPNYEKFLHVLTAVGAKYDVPVWHFSPYSQLTSFDVLSESHKIDSDDTNVHSFYDPGHASHALVSDALRLVKGFKTRNDTPSDFAVKLLPKTVDGELAKLAQSRLEFLKTAPDILSLMPKRQPADRCQ